MTETLPGVSRHRSLAFADVMHVDHTKRGSHTHVVEVFRVLASKVSHPTCLQPHRGLRIHHLRCKDGDLLLELERHVAGNAHQQPHVLLLPDTRCSHTQAFRSKRVYVKLHSQNRKPSIWIYTVYNHLDDTLTWLGAKTKFEYNILKNMVKDTAMHGAWEGGIGDVTRTEDRGACH
jgi:hypothetical protein